MGSDLIFHPYPDPPETIESLERRLAELKAKEPMKFEAICLPESNFQCDICREMRVIGVDTLAADYVQGINQPPNALDICNECVLAMSAICPPDVKQLPAKKLLAALIVANMKGLLGVLANEPVTEQLTTTSSLVTAMILVSSHLEKML